MKPALIIALLPVFAACGQTGPLYLPDASVETPVEIRTTAPAPAPAPAAADEDKDKEKPNTQPPGG
jgi:predicted small lipoprotein YifL